MTPAEFYRLYEARKPQDPRRTLSEEDYEELAAMLD